MTEMSALRSNIDVSFLNSSLVPEERPLMLVVRMVTVDWDFFHLLYGLMVCWLGGGLVTRTGIWLKKVLLPSFSYLI